jgi:hypothetical protein
MCAIKLRNLRQIDPKRQYRRRDTEVCDSLNRFLSLTCLPLELSIATKAVSRIFVDIPGRLNRLEGLAWFNGHETHGKAERLLVAKRVIMRLEVVPQARDSIALVVARNGMTNVTVHSRVIQWFVSQPEMLQVAILGLLPEGTQFEIGEEVLLEFREKQESSRGSPKR